MKTEKTTKKTTKTNAVATQESALPASALADRIAQDAGAGMEGVDRDSFAIPFVRVLQQMSPQCTAGKTGYNPAAKAGQFINTVTGELIDGNEGFIFIPCAFQRRFIQWAPRSSTGGSYKGEWLPEDVAAKLVSGELKKGDDGRIYVGEPNPKKSDYVADTRNHFGLMVTDKGVAQVLLSLSSTQIKKSKQLMGMLSSIRINGQVPPTWLSKIRITTLPESNDQGSWFGIRVEHAGFVDDPKLYDMAREFHDTIVAGMAKADYHDAEADDSTDEEEKF
jgi:hypothetical protein